VVSALKVVTRDIVLSANHPDARKWLEHVAIMSDERDGIGGISGIQRGLSSGRNVLVVAWDMPFVTGDLLAAIATAGIEQHADAAVPVSNSPRGIEPFCAWYSTTALAPLNRFLVEGGGSASDFVGRLPRVHRIPQSVTARFGDPRVLFFSVNTPQELAEARAMAEAAQ
jgi:molybdopterin-guanine dinucleotide biosynthesis protein A